MDLVGAEQSRRDGRRRTELGAFAFLLLAGALLIGSLLMPLWDSRSGMTHRGEWHRCATCAWKPAAMPGAGGADSGAGFLALLNPMP
jgi:hypothetical protein